MREEKEKNMASTEPSRSAKIRTRLIFPDPFVPVMIPQGFWIAARPPHPHASAIQ
jgi:hypothetical protein